MNRASRPTDDRGGDGGKDDRGDLRGVPEPKSHGRSGMNAPTTEREERRARGAPRRPERAGIDAELVAGVRLERSLGILHQLRRDLTSGVGSDAARHVDLRELDGLDVRVAARARGARCRARARAARAAPSSTRTRPPPSRTRPRRARQPLRSARRRRRARAGDAEDQRDVRHEPVADAEHRGPGDAAA